MNSKPHLKMAFLDQGIGKLIKGLVAETAVEIGPVAFLTAERDLVIPSVTHFAMPPNANRSARERIWGWIKYLLSAGWAIFFCIPGRPLLFIVSNPPVSPFLGVLARKLKRQQYILLFYDMYPEALENLRGMSRQSVVSRLWRSMNAVAIRNAAAVVTISPDLARTLRQYYATDADAARVEIVPTWADTDDIHPRAKTDNWFAMQNHQEDKLTVFYSGNIGAVHDLSLLPAVANRLRQYDDIHFLIVGDGVGRAPLESECAQLNLRNVTFLPFQPEAVLPFSLATADISVVSLASGGEGVSMPSKTYYMMAAGSALLSISASGSDLAAVVESYKCGINVAPGDAEGAASAILAMRNDSGLLQKYRENARSAAVTQFSAEVCIPQMISIFTQVLQST